MTILASHTLHAQNFYKWIDAKGSTHYTTTPPPKNAQKLGKIMTYNDSVTSSAKPATATNTTQQNPQKTESSNNPSEQSQHSTQPQTNNEKIPLPPQSSDTNQTQPAIPQQGRAVL
ncbi:DUF4124 domain-containing protein [Acinetobacter qingfengensis]|uniref:Uncharacterized protein n=2 Tax=Acinetobacter qingfengensis TaxID=1262585 RepID=A0A1E7RDZ7_9GAMM|nr:DUF4124 domain-containing protein [Acinetobacter qingfengensis]KAA8734577.1 DUF4124 domain-containing protein [Acinetobacter qingfengensis]OEY97561.1 hypothetical protein BJI46_09410 [Acinetobacter qingfengensis]